MISTPTASPPAGATYEEEAVTEIELHDKGGAAGQKLAHAAEHLRAALISVVAEGVGPVTGSATYADDRFSRVHDVGKAISRVIHETEIATGTTGFVTGLGGLATMPISVPASLAGAAVLNARMVGSIAHLRGYDLHDPFVQQILLLVVAGSSANDAVKTVGVKIGTKMAEKSVEKVSIETIRRINQKVGFMLLAKYGTKRSAVTLVKIVPFVGGVVSGTVDAVFTKAIASAAKKAFPADGK
jgi:hypothetical protein